MSQDLTPKQEAFCVEYLANGQNATQAYCKAYGKVASASINVKACELLQNGKVSVRIKELLAPAFKKHEVTVERIVAEYAKLAFLDPRKFYDESGQLIPIHMLHEDVAAALAGTETTIGRSGSDVDGKPLYEDVRKIRFVDKRAALDSLAKHMGMFIERHEHTGNVTVTINSQDADI